MLWGKTRKQQWIFNVLTSTHTFEMLVNGNLCHKERTFILSMKPKIKLWKLKFSQEFNSFCSLERNNRLYPINPSLAGRGVTTWN